VDDPALLEAKQSGGEVQQVPEVPDSGAAVVDLMSALRRSVERARGGSADDADAGSDSGSDSDEEAPAAKAPAKKAAAKKAAPAKKAPAKKAAAAKKTTAGSGTAAKKTADKPPAKRARRSA
jgi:DNA end-binding protein Ku